MKRILLIGVLVGIFVSGLFAAWAVDDGFYVIPVTKMAVPKGAIIMWSGEITNDGHPVINGQPDKKWQACDGNNGTPDLRDRFVRGSSSPWDTGYGGKDTVTLKKENLPAHSHPGGHTDYWNETHNHATNANTTIWYSWGLAAAEVVDTTRYGYTSYTSPAHEHTITESGECCEGTPLVDAPAYYACTFVMYLGN